MSSGNNDVAGHYFEQSSNVMEDLQHQDQLKYIKCLVYCIEAPSETCTNDIYRL